MTEISDLYRKKSLETSLTLNLKVITTEKLLSNF